MTNENDPQDLDNTIFLRGRLAAEPVVVDMPSGDVMATFRLTVSRRQPSRVKVDSFECATVRPRVRRSLERVCPGDVLEVHGSLQRRFWRSPAGPASRYTVDVESLKVQKAPKVQKIAKVSRRAAE